MFLSRCFLVRHLQDEMRLKEVTIFQSALRASLAAGNNTVSPAVPAARTAGDFGAVRSSGFGAGSRGLSDEDALDAAMRASLVTGNYNNNSMSSPTAPTAGDAAGPPRSDTGGGIGRYNQSYSDSLI